MSTSADIGSATVGGESTTSVGITTTNSETTSTIASTTTNPPSTTTTDDLTTTTIIDTTTTTIDTTSGIVSATTTTDIISDTSAIASITTTSDVISASSAVVTVISSNSQVVTFTSTSFSETPTATTSPAGGVKPSSTNTGAIAGGVVGGVVFVALIGALLFFFKRRRDKNNKMDYEEDDGIGAISTTYNRDYNAFGTPTVISDNNSLPSSRPLSTNTNLPPGGVATGLKPRPFVQAYDPTKDEQSSDYSGYDSSNNNKLNDYQFAYNNNPVYPRDNYYASAYEPMMSNNTLTELEQRNVPNENDYNPGRRLSRHVPDEKYT